MVVALSLALPSARAAGSIPTLYFTYSMNCTFRLTDDSGKAVGAIAAGTYQVEISTPGPFGLPDLSGITDLTACQGAVNFRLTGPGVKLFTDLEYGDQTFEHYPETFQPNATYVAQDDHQPAVARAVFTTFASSPPPTPTSSAATSTGSKGSSQTEIAGSAVLKFRGALDATVYKTGKLALNRTGKAVSSLKQGKYTFSVDDESKTAGFTLKSLRGKAVTITSKAFVGDHNVTVSLKQGRWYFYSPGGKQLQFIVSS